MILHTWYAAVAVPNTNPFGKLALSTFSSPYSEAHAACWHSNNVTRRSTSFAIFLNSPPISDDSVLLIYLVSSSTCRQHILCQTDLLRQLLKLIKILHKYISEGIEIKLDVIYFWIIKL